MKWRRENEGSPTQRRRQFYVPSSEIDLYQRLDTLASEIQQAATEVSLIAALIREGNNFGSPAQH